MVYVDAQPLTLNIRPNKINSWFLSARIPKSLHVNFFFQKYIKITIFNIGLMKSFW